MQLKFRTIMTTSDEKNPTLQPVKHLLAQQLDTLQRVAELWSKVIDRIGSLAVESQRRVQRELLLRTQPPDESLLEYVRTVQESLLRAAPTALKKDKVTWVIGQSHPRFRSFLYRRTFKALEHLAREARSV
ncbi:hypothetical protein HPB51_019234 [Rhipicephalus microplus]|uniref:Uncharacterized protein n=1 Tax=Rhipicephalus microplus TaxID=6941 RepID=A0A9J6E3Z9_RHIMP|nr:hypothetical protein HPB51_019234 [Rhipicephalus microplus]